nr:HTH-type transcriptional regulator SrpR [Vibrio sp.]
MTSNAVKGQINKNKKRQMIIDGARQVFLSEGYSNANMDHIAEAAKVTKQTVYRYFPSKLDLFQSVICEMEMQFDFSLLNHLFGGSAREALDQFAYKYVQFTISEDSLATYRFLISEYAHMSNQSCHYLVAKEITEHILRFIERRFGLRQTESPTAEEAIQLWFAMLLSLRSDLIMGMPKPADDQVFRHAIIANSILLSAIT